MSKPDTRQQVSWNPHTCQSFSPEAEIYLVVQEQQQAPDADFAPNLVNTVCWLINFITQLTTFSVNYMGEPFNTGITTNRGLWTVVRWGTLGYVLLVLDVVPGFASGIALVSHCACVLGAGVWVGVWGWGKHSMGWLCGLSAGLSCGRLGTVRVQAYSC